MPDSNATQEWIRAIAPWAGGGLAGAILSAIVTKRRSRTPAITKIVSISHIDLPEIMPGYTSNISLTRQGGKESDQTKYFPRLSIAQIKIINAGHKDFDEFKLGIKIPDECRIIGFQYKTDEVLHVVDFDPIVSVEKPSNMLTLTLKPLQKKDRYKFTLVIDGMIEGHNDNIIFSRIAAARIIEGNEKPRINTIGLIISYLIIFSIGGAVVYNYDRIEMKNFIYVIIAALIGTATSSFIIWKVKI